MIEREKIDEVKRIMGIPQDENIPDEDIKKTLTYQQYDLGCAWEELAKVSTPDFLHKVVDAINKSITWKGWE